MPASISDTGSFARYALPYVLQKIEHPTYKHVYIMLNRDYKPLGVVKHSHSDHVNYDDYSDHHIRFNKDPNTFKDVWFAADQPLVLYNDGDASRKDYFERLGRLYAKGTPLVRKMQR